MENPHTKSNKKEQELRWRLAVCFAGLLHGIGKPVSDMAVVDRQGEHTWNPCDENLTDWATRNGIDRYWRMQPQGLEVTLYILRLVSAELIYSNEPPIVVGGIEVDDVPGQPLPLSRSKTAHDWSLNRTSRLTSLSAPWNLQLRLINKPRRAAKLRQIMTKHVIRLCSRHRQLKKKVTIHRIRKPAKR